MDISEHIDALRQQGSLLADAAERSGLDAAIPPCPAWQVKDLLRHTGYIHRWAARHITECPDAVLDGPSEEDILRGGAADPDLLAWFRASARPGSPGRSTRCASGAVGCRWTGAGSDIAATIPGKASMAREESILMRW